MLLKEIDIFSSGLKELEEANSNLGLALNEDEIQYLYENYKTSVSRTLGMWSSCMC